MIFFTSILSNYLSRALLLADSVFRHHPLAHFRIYIYDYESLPDGCLGRLASSFAESDQLRLEFLDSTTCLPDPYTFLSRYDVIEACTAVKPFIAQQILDTRECCIYLDPDTYVYAPLFPDGPVSYLGQWDLQLTPHVLSSSPNALLSERLFFAYGIFNLGYFAIQPTDSALRFVRWWCAIVETYGVNMPPAGLFVDQKPLDFAPAYVERLHIVRHPGWNVAWWNLFSDGRNLCSGHKIAFDEITVPLVFFHFSNLDADSLRPFVSRPLRDLSSAHHELLLMSAHPEISNLYHTYLQLLASSESFVAQALLGLRPIVVRKGFLAKLSRLVNSELYRLTLICFHQPSSSSIYSRLILLPLPVRLYWLIRLFMKSGIGFTRHVRLAGKLFLRVLLSPSLFDYSHAPSRSNYVRDGSQ
jgi:hypothetical protein